MKLNRWAKSVKNVDYDTFYLFADKISIEIDASQVPTKLDNFERLSKHIQFHQIQLAQYAIQTINVINLDGKI